MLWIHGLGESGLCFENLLSRPAFANWDHVIPDLLGYGRTPGPSPPASLDDHTELLLSLLPQTTGQRTVIAGHSLGGVIGTFLCERAEEEIDGFLDIEGNISLDDCTYSLRAAAFSDGESVDSQFENMVAEVELEGRAHERLAGYAKSLRLCDARAFKRNGIELVEVSKDEFMAPRLATLPIPTLYIYGSPGGTGEHSRALLQREGVALCGIAPAGHWPFLDQPADFARAVSDFLAPIG